MRKIEVQIKEKDTRVKSLSLLNLRDEVVNFLYKDTIANSTRTDLQFFVLFFFMVLKVKDRTLAEQIFDEAIPKFKKLNDSFSEKKRILRTGEYRKLVEDNGLTELFSYDIFFVLVEALLNIEEIESKFSLFIKERPELEGPINNVKAKYAKELKTSLRVFRSSKIEDDRYDDYGNYHDLSKSVYRTVRMRNARNLDLNLQKYTSVKVITSKSPIELIFLQYIDPEIIFDLWDKYHLAEYIQAVAPDVVNAVRARVDFRVNLGDLIGDLVVAWILYKWIRPSERKEKAKAKREFQNAKRKPTSDKALVELTSTLVKSVLKAHERLEKEIEESKKQIHALSSKGAAKDKEAIKKLEERITKLENLTVTTKVVDSSDEN